MSRGSSHLSLDVYVHPDVSRDRRQTKNPRRTGKTCKRTRTKSQPMRAKPSTWTTRSRRPMMAAGSVVSTRARSNVNSAGGALRMRCPAELRSLRRLLSLFLTFGIAFGGRLWPRKVVRPLRPPPSAARLREVAHELGRLVPSISVGGHAILVDSPTAIESFIRVLVDVHRMAPEEAEAVPVTGGPEQVAERLHAYSEARADMVGLSLDGEDWTRQVETLAEARAQLSRARTEETDEG